MSLPNTDKPTNRLLASIPEHLYQNIVPYLQPVELKQHLVLYHAGENYDYAYFPSHSIVSTVAIMENGSTTEIGVIGNEGMVGLPIILNTGYTNSTAIVQVGDGGYKIAASQLREQINRHQEIKQLMMRYVQARIIELGQTAACNRYHSVEQRFARWLLTVSDNIQKDEFQLTQEFISHMIGVRRSGVSEVAGKFQREGIIKYSRGKIGIVDREKLKASTCECHGLIQKEFSRLLKFD